MSAVDGPLILMVLALLWTLNRGEVCVVNQSCILPCSFQRGDDVVIHWNQLVSAGPERIVHSFYNNKDQLLHQHKRFRDRTSLFPDKIPQGNASLKLTGVEVQDEGRYKCYTSVVTGNRDTFIDLEVEAPVHKVHIQWKGERISCSSEEVYPEPRLTWSTSSSSNVTPADKPTVHRTERQLYTISSSLTPSHTSESDSYTCTISAGRHTHTATWFNPTQTSVSDTETIILCPALNTSWRGLIWTFNHSQTIMSHSVSDTVFEEWRRYVKDVSGTGSLTLQHLTSGLAGVYTCEISSDEETCIRDTYLSITEKHGAGNVGVIAGGVIGGILVLIAISGFLSKKCRQRTTPYCLNSNGTKAETQPSAEVPLRHSHLT